MGARGEQLLNSLMKRLLRYLKPKVKIIKLYNTTKTSMFCSSKDKTPTEQKSKAIYQIVCPGCHSFYVGKTESCFATRMDEQGSKLDQPMYQHSNTCEMFNEIASMYALPNMNCETPSIDIQSHILNAMLFNCKIIDMNNWSQLCYLEAFYIKTSSPKINVGLKASKDLRLFY